jgi:hypothetical protein|tara:strand:- start:35 stop:178 length:144 start_codon:yes stop_codon:yes gene_type:complete
MNAKLMAFATTALAVVAGIYVYNEFIKADDSSKVVTEGESFSGRRRR